MPIEACDAMKISREDVPESYNWDLDDLVERPPFSQPETVRQLREGRFIINGEPSDSVTALKYMHRLADKHRDTLAGWEALSTDDDVALNGVVF